MTEGERPAGSGGPGTGTENPMSADRRTLVIAAAAMVVLVGVGVVSSAIFTRSACRALEPEPVAAPVAGADVEAVLGGAFDDVDGDVIGQVTERLGTLVGGRPLSPGVAGDGQLTGAVDVGPAGAVTGLGEGVAATGPRITAVAGPEGPATAVELSDEATIVGDGEHLYALAVANELTGQLDGIVTIDSQLSGGECFDTAQVGVPLPFHLDAGGGQLLLFRIDDDGDNPEVEVRDADGPVWSEPVELGGGPPGVLAERLTGRLGGDTVVTARRALVDDRAPALQVRDRADGSARWERTAAELDGLAPAGDQPLQVGVVEVTDDLVLVGLSREEQAPVLLVAFDLSDGRSVWTSDLDAAQLPRSAGTIDDEVVLVAARDVIEDDAQATYEVARIDTGDGSARTLYSAAGRRASAAVIDSRIVFAVDDEVTRVDPDGTQHAVELPLPVVDVHAVDGQVALLLRSSEGGALVWARP